MAIFVTGDTHGAERIGFTSYDGFLSRFSMAAFPEQKELTKEDFVVILGDFGGIWETNRFKFEETMQEKYALDALDKRSFTTLFVPGNHENYDRLTGCTDEALLNSWLYKKMPPSEKAKLRQGYPRQSWHGGTVRVIRPSVLMLERGDIFDIDGKKCFAFGGARSHDIRDGILYPADYSDKESFDAERRKWIRHGKQFRISGISWWKQEVPSPQEMQHGYDTLQEFRKTGGVVDFVFTHDAPSSDKIYMGYGGDQTFSTYLESLRDKMDYGKWFYGHLHDNRRVLDKHYLLYDQIIRIA